MRFKPHILAALAAVFISGTAIAQGLISSDRLIGRDTAGVGQVEQLTVGGGIEFSGAGGITLNTDTIFDGDFGDFTCTAGACVIDADSIALGTDTTGDYVSTLTGTANEVEVSGGTGEGSTPTIGLPNTISVATAIELSHASENTLTASSGTLSIEGVALLNATTADALFLTPAEGDAAYQPLDSDLTSWAGVTRASGFDTFAATPSSANLGALLTDDAFLLSDADLAALASPGTLPAEGSPASGDFLIGYIDGAYKTVDFDDLPGAASGDMLTTNNLSDLTSPSDARDNLGLGALAVEDDASGVPVSPPVRGESNAQDALESVADALTGRNHIINGGMMVAQRGTSFTSTGSANNDDTYNLDRWILLADGNDIVDVTQSTDAPSGALNSIALDVETVDKKFGILQIVEQKNAIGLIGREVTLSFWAKATGSGKLDNLKAAIIAWSSTADTVTSDVVSAWGAEDTNPTLASNWTYENTPANLGVTSSWARYSVTATIDTASAANVAVFIWSDVDDTDLGDFLRISNVQLERGLVATEFEHKLFDEVLWDCQRRFTAFSFSQSTNYALPRGYGDTPKWWFQFPVPMAHAPTASMSTTSDFEKFTDAGTWGSASIAAVTNNAYRGYMGIGDAETAGRTRLLRNTTTGWTVFFDAEL